MTANNATSVTPPLSHVGRRVWESLERSIRREGHGNRPGPDTVTPLDVFTFLVEFTSAGQNLYDANVNQATIRRHMSRQAGTTAWPEPSFDILTEASTIASEFGCEHVNHWHLLLAALRDETVQQVILSTITTPLSALRYDVEAALRNGNAPTGTEPGPYVAWFDQVKGGELAAEADLFDTITTLEPGLGDIIDSAVTLATRDHAEHVEPGHLIVAALTTNPPLVDVPFGTLQSVFLNPASRDDDMSRAPWIPPAGIVSETLRNLPARAEHTGHQHLTRDHLILAFFDTVERAGRDDIVNTLRNAGVDVTDVVAGARKRATRTVADDTQSWTVTLTRDGPVTVLADAVAITAPGDVTFTDAGGSILHRFLHGQWLTVTPTTRPGVGDVNTFPPAHLHHADQHH